jgi:ABC-type phosphate/phosphonate transport system substrate-binding protein
MADVIGHRIAFTTTDSQSGFAAPLRYLRLLDTHQTLFSELISPQQTPLGAVRAVVDQLAETAPVDSLALDLMRRYRPELIAQIRVLAGTEPRPIPPLTGSAPNEALSAAFAAAHQDPNAAHWMQMLELRRFERPVDSDYNILAEEFEATLNYWRTHRLAERIHAAYTEALGMPEQQQGA